MKKRVVATKRPEITVNKDFLGHIYQSIRLLTHTDFAIYFAWQNRFFLYKQP